MSSPHDYDEMTNHDVLSAAEIREYEEAGEALLDAQDEERWAAEEAATEAQHDAEDPWDGLADGEER